MAELLICPEHDPDRCTTITDKGQCTNYAQPNDTRCSMHSSVHSAIAKKGRMHDLYVNKFQQDIRNFSDAGTTSLKAEISIVRVVLQNLLATCKCSNDLIINMGPITTLSAKIADMASVIDRIAMNSGNLLDADDILQLGTRVVQAIGKHVKDPAILDALSVEIIDLFSASLAQDEEVAV